MVSELRSDFIVVQYVVVLLLVITSYSAYVALKAEAFLVLSVAWVLNLAYLIASNSSAALDTAIGLPGSPSRLAAATALDLLTAGLFIYAVRTTARRVPWYLRFPSSHYSFLLASAILTGSLALIEGEVLQTGESVRAAADVVHMFVFATALFGVAHMLGEIVAARTKSFRLDDHLAVGGAYFYGFIQVFSPFGPIAHDIGFGLGVIAKGAILLGLVRLLVVAAESGGRASAYKKTAKREWKALYRVAHELGTPVSALVGLAPDLVASAPKSGPWRSLAEKLEQDVNRLAAIVDALRETGLGTALTRVGGKANEYDPELKKRRHISMNTMAEYAITMVKETRPEAVLLQRQYASHVEVYCIPGEVIQVIINVLRNAYDGLAQRDGEDASVWVRSGKEAGEKAGRRFVQVYLEIEDNGEGVDDVDLAMNEGFTTRRGRGRGFGLAVSVDLLRNNDGTIEIESPPMTRRARPEGTLVTLKLPHAPSADDKKRNMEEK